MALEMDSIYVVYKVLWKFGPSKTYYAVFAHVCTFISKCLYSTLAMVKYLSCYMHTRDD